MQHRRPDGELFYTQVPCDLLPNQFGLKKHKGDYFLVFVLAPKNLHRLDWYIIKQEGSLSNPHWSLVKFTFAGVKEAFCGELSGNDLAEFLKQIQEQLEEIYRPTLPSQRKLEEIYRPTLPSQRKLEEIYSPNLPRTPYDSLERPLLPSSTPSRVLFLLPPQIYQTNKLPSPQPPKTPYPSLAAPLTFTGDNNQQVVSTPPPLQAMSLKLIPSKQNNSPEMVKNYSFFDTMLTLLFGCHSGIHSTTEMAKRPF